METQSPITSKGFQSVTTLLANRKWGDLLLFIAIFIGTLCLVLGLVMGGIANGSSLVLTIMALLVISALVIRWPIVGFFVIVGCTLLIEQNPLQFSIKALSMSSPGLPPCKGYLIVHLVFSCFSSYWSSYFMVY